MRTHHKRCSVAVLEHALRHADWLRLLLCRCGIVGFEVPMAEASKARNILEEIVW